jgi:oxygen-independent coproporphyrinogen-3 oxidase
VGNNDHWFEAEVLSVAAQWNECFLTGLRTKWGVSKDKIQGFGGFHPTEKRQLESYLSDGLMCEEEGFYSLTEKGKLQADGISASFFRLD